MIAHPDVPGSLLHFTGRTRAIDDPPPAHAAGTAEQRLAQILTSGLLVANGTFGTRGPVVCFSELSDLALATLLSTGLNTRGPYEPWGIVLHRQAIADLDAGPVWYMRDTEIQATEDLPAIIADRRVRSNPGGVPDWMGEREWRICWGQWPYPPAPAYVELLPHMIYAVIVGKQQWHPTSQRPPLLVNARRWLWVPDRLVDDGNFAF